MEPLKKIFINEVENINPDMTKAIKSYYDKNNKPWPELITVKLVQSFPWSWYDLLKNKKKYD